MGLLRTFNLTPRSSHTRKAQPLTLRKLLSRSETSGTTRRRRRRRRRKKNNNNNNNKLDNNRNNAPDGKSSVSLLNDYVSPQEKKTAPGAKRRTGTGRHRLLPGSAPVRHRPTGLLTDDFAQQGLNPILAAENVPRDVLRRDAPKGVETGHGFAPTRFWG